MTFPPTGADTNILLRLVVHTDPQYSLVRAAVDSLIREKTPLYAAFQNIAELWNVLTRPKENGGQNWLPIQASMAIVEVEKTFQILTESQASYALWRQVVVEQGVAGVQVHDARLACVLITSDVTQLLTPNGRDLKRFGVTPVTPADITSQAQKN